MAVKSRNNLSKTGAEKTSAEKTSAKTIGGYVGKYGALALAIARLVYDVLVHTDVLR
jgi:hypothetical protein